MERERIYSLVEQYERPLCQYARGFVGDRARDIVQDTFLKLCRQIDTIDEKRAASWLYRVCRNRAIDVIRKDKPMQVLSDERQARIASKEPDPAAFVETRDSISRIMRAVEGLPGPQEEAIRLRFQHCMSYREIATVMDITVSRVSSLIHIGIKTLRTQLVIS